MAYQFRYQPGSWLYQTIKPWAHGLKVLLQMLVGIGAVLDIGWHVWHSLSHHIGTQPFMPPINDSVEVIAAALAVAAVIELAYTLFTPGPDEALDPLILGLSSGLLMLVTKIHDGGIMLGLAMFIGVLSLAALILIRHYLIKDVD
jgi:hypothetical protein